MTRTAHTARYFMSIFTITVVILGTVFVLNDARSRSSDWYVAYLSDGAIYLSRSLSMVDDVLLLSEVYRLDTTKAALPTDASGESLVVQEVKNWYSLTPVTEIQPFVTTKEGTVLVPERYVLLWGSLDDRSELARAIGFETPTR